MGAYGRYVAGSDGWDDGFGDTVDSGDDASNWLMMFNEVEPQDDVDDGDDETTEEWPHQDDAVEGSDSSDRLGAHGEPMEVLQEWARTWGALSQEMQQRFLARDQVRALCEFPKGLVFAAIHSTQWLDCILSRVTEMSVHDHPEWFYEGEDFSDEELGIDPTDYGPDVASDDDL